MIDLIMIFYYIPLFHVLSVITMRLYKNVEFPRLDMEPNSGKSATSAISGRAMLKLCVFI